MQKPEESFNILVSPTPFIKGDYNNILLFNFLHKIIDAIRINGIIPLSICLEIRPYNECIT